MSQPGYWCGRVHRINLAERLLPTVAVTGVDCFTDIRRAVRSGTWRHSRTIPLCFVEATW